MINEEKIAFFCSTPYQILIAIQLKHSLYKRNHADLYLLDHFNDSENYAIRIREKDIFNKVFHVKCFKFSDSFNNNIFKRSIRKLRALYSFEKLSKKYLKIVDDYYSDIYLSYPDIIIQIGIKKIYKNNKNVKVHIFEDGTAGYTNTLRRNKKIKIIYNKITGSGKIIDRYDELLVFKPELMPKTNIKIKKIPPLNIKDVNFKTIINYIFGYKKWIITEKIVFFEQPYNSTNLYNEIKKIADEILFENYIVKLHPRSKKDNYRYFNIYENNNIPWEIICLNNDIESKILISFYSTATITNKILFNKEPILIFLFNLPHLKEIHPLNDDTIKFITEFKKTYKDPNRILIPDSIDSLKISLETLLND